MTNRKFIHPDKTETIVKEKHFKFDDNLEVVETPYDFTTFFISVSYGCQYNCPFCHTSLIPDYKLLKPAEIVENNLKIMEEYKDHKIRISFMGMGEPIHYHYHFNEIAEAIAGKNLHSITVGSSLPATKSNIVHSLNGLINGKFYYSLHSPVQEIRDKMVPETASLEDAKAFMKKLTIKKICHYTLVGGVNDSDLEVELAIKFCKETNSQLRIVPLNPIHDYIESNRLKEIQAILSQSDIDWKIHYSSGRETKTACGMFF